MNLSRIQDQLASGKKITRASQDPVVAMNGMRYRTQVAEISQFRRNLSETYNWIEQADSALTEVTQALQRIRELTVQAANDTNNASQRAIIGTEIKQLLDHIASIGNTKVNDKFIFNGTNTTESPVDLGKLGNFTNIPQFESLQVEQHIIAGKTLDQLGGTINHNPPFKHFKIPVGSFEEGSEFKLKFPNDLPDGENLPTNREFTATRIEDGFAYFDGQDIEEFYDYYSQHQDLLDDITVDVSFEGTSTEIGFLDENGYMESQTGSSFLSLPIGSVMVDDEPLRIDSFDKVTLTINGNDHEMKYNAQTRQFEWATEDGTVPYTQAQLQDATVLVEKPLFTFEIEATAVENPDDYFISIEVDGREFRLFYDQGTGKYTNNTPIRTNTPLEALKDIEGTVKMRPEASPTSTNQEHVQMELLKGVSISSNITPQNVFSNQFFADIQSIIEEIQTLTSELEEGTAHTRLSGYIDKMDIHINNVVSEQAELGARMNRIQLMEWRVTMQEVIAKRTLSENEDADLEKVIIDLTTQETVHRAAMAAGARIIQPSLLDFLR